MTISSETNKSGPYAGNGVTTVFAYGFPISDAAHIKVIATDALGNEVVKTLTTHYTVSGVGSPTGSITMLAAPAAGTFITNIRNVPFTQATHLENQGAYFAQVVEAALDAGVARDQQLKELADRSVKLPASADSSTLDALVADISRLADSSDAVDTVAGIQASVVTVAGIQASVVTVAGVAAAVGASPANAAAAAASAAAAAASATTASTGATSTAADRIAVAADKATVAADKATVATNKGLVDTAKAAVDTAKAAVDIAKAAADADLVLTHADVVLTHADVISSAASAATAVAAAAGLTTVPVQTIAGGAITAPADIDLIPVVVVSGSVMKKITWANVKAAIWTALGALIGGGTAKATPIDADAVPLADSASGNATKSLSITNLWLNYLKGKADALYAPIAGAGGMTLLASSQPTTNVTSITLTGLSAKRNWFVGLLIEKVSASAGNLMVEFRTSGGTWRGPYTAQFNSGASTKTFASHFTIMNAGSADLYKTMGESFGGNNNTTTAIAANSAFGTAYTFAEAWDEIRFTLSDAGSFMGATSAERGYLYVFGL